MRRSRLSRDIRRDIRRELLSEIPQEALFFLAATGGMVPFLSMSMMLSELTKALFLWLLTCFSFLVSSGGERDINEQETLETLWLTPLHPWQILWRAFWRRLLGSGAAFILMIVFLSTLYGFSTPLKWALIIGFASALPSLICIGLLVHVIAMGTGGETSGGARGGTGGGGSLFQACLLFPFALPPLLLGWGLVEALATRHPHPWPCMVGLMGLWCIHGCLTLSLGAWALKQRLLA